MKINTIIAIAFFIMINQSCKKEVPQQTPLTPTISIEDDIKLVHSEVYGSYYAVGSKIVIPEATIKSNAVAFASIDGTNLSPIPNGWVLPGNSDEPFNNRPSQFFNGSKIGSSVSNGAGGSRVATNGYFYMDFQADGNLVLYRSPSTTSTAGSVAIWASGKNQPWPTAIIKYSFVEFTLSGDIYCWSSTGGSYWGAGKSSTARPIWVLQNDGNFVGYSGYFVTYVSDPSPTWPPAFPPYYAITITGAPFAATGTSGGSKSSHPGKL